MNLIPVFFDIEATEIGEFVGWCVGDGEFQYGSIPEFVSLMNASAGKLVLIGKNSSVSTRMVGGKPSIPYDLPFIYFRMKGSRLSSKELSDYVIAFNPTTDPEGYSWISGISQVFRDGVYFADIQDIEQYVGGSLKFISVKFLGIRYTDSLSTDPQEVLRYNKLDVEITRELYRLNGWGEKHLSMLLSMCRDFGLETRMLNSQRVVNKYVHTVLKVNTGYNLRQHVEYMKKCSSRPYMMDIAKILHSRKLNGFYFPPSLRVKNLNIYVGLGGLHGGVNDVHIKEIEGVIYITNIDFAGFYSNVYSQINMLAESQKRELLSIARERNSIKQSDPIKAGGYKKLLNSLFGKFSNVDAFGNLGIAYVTSIAQLVMLELLERIIKISDIQIVDINTDGFMFVSCKPFYEGVDKFQFKVHNMEYTLEIDRIGEVFYKDVSNYILVDTRGKVKKKGAFGGNNKMSGTVSPNKSTPLTSKDKVIATKGDKVTIKYGVPNLVHFDELLEVHFTRRVDPDMIPDYNLMVYQQWGEIEGDHYGKMAYFNVDHSKVEDFVSATPISKGEYDNFSHLVHDYGASPLCSEEQVLEMADYIMSCISRQVSTITDIKDIPIAEHPRYECEFKGLLTRSLDENGVELFKKKVTAYKKTHRTKDTWITYICTTPHWVVFRTDRQLGEVVYNVDAVGGYLSDSDTKVGGTYRDNIRDINLIEVVERFPYKRRQKKYKP